MPEERHVDPGREAQRVRDQWRQVEQLDGAGVDGDVDYGGAEADDGETAVLQAERAARPCSLSTPPMPCQVVQVTEIE